jgi:hypothetical protein
MSNKRTRKQNQRRAAERGRPAVTPRRPRRFRPRLKVAAAALGLLLTAAAASQLGPVRRAVHLAGSPPAASVQQSAEPLLAKEYVYAGGRLVAVEEPAPAPPASGPSNLVAAATTPTQVSLVWSPPSSGTVARYQVERGTSLSGPFSQLTPEPTAAAFTDTTASAGAAYLYRVRAVFAGGATSEYSNRDLATTFTFADDPLVAEVTPVKGQHVAELRQAVNAVRAAAGLSAAGWTDASLSGQWIKAVHMEELRARVDEALTALGLATNAYTDPSLSGVTVRKVHVEELRARVR